MIGRSHIQREHIKRNQGIALPAVIFMIVIVALLVGAMARILNVSSAITDIRLQSSRAFWAAKAGSEWAAYQIHANGNCAAATGTLSINGFSVQVGCASADYDEAGNTVRVYEVNVQAQSAGSPTDLDYVSRQLTVVLNVES
ncbi:MAG: pilus assembly protein MshP [Ketobacter sp.]|nr:MAG: pilus assembly protein MshP [Ketobacter sp.]